ncbi:tRNA (adenosine(37)-N6)-threonylcarbamoyltransferase complex ATPase subunit type 1 TsaE [Rhodohalobacter mucosus]|uniref:tRNA threonylcarbamoyladenosine biosynthesis protein TsaE n=1 Tax=Rhodohalobacter mucosus TaxID=2079485 RepID=A0A316TUI9_9BACT|nr:tRNA (adenosine(37)-N6)-threonylcarbamoyltransferase complex ATPase subunit type 1 TsaE [Rhodohalobacter mucosus]PWN08167.1 tRNA (adenosine(37)-N6)-threonylcarbamoyltransferase complex ATPase subunit type 1 TsaE [Rhodohalobacter mucosus]
MTQDFISHSVSETLRIAEEFAETVSPGDVILLEGDLGAGKTHFVKGFVRRFGLSSEVVSSPTFTIINEYIGSLAVYHFDFYRIENIEEALEIGTEEYLYGTGVCIVEWPERVRDILPEDAQTVHITTIAPEKRMITIVG